VEGTEGMEAVSRIHPDVRRAMEQIDAALMNGDTFYDGEARQELYEYVRSWLRVIEEIDEESDRPDESEEDESDE
jgi:hypothetical protein